jgi:hypothetical protein
LNTGSSCPVVALKKRRRRSWKKRDPLERKKKSKDMM